MVGKLGFFSEYAYLYLKFKNEMVNKESSEKIPPFLWVWQLGIFQIWRAI